MNRSRGNKIRDFRTTMFFYRPRRRPNYGVYLLAYQLFNGQYVPPVTLAAILFQVAAYLDFIPVIGPDNTGNKHAVSWLSG